MKKLLVVNLFFFLFFITPLAKGGNKDQPDPPQIIAVYTDQELNIDGELNETAWEKAAPVTGFWLNFPADTALSNGQTYVRVLYDDQNIYIGAYLEHGKIKPQRYIASSLRRDFPFIENDAFGVVIDAFEDQTIGYGFYVSAYGVQREEQIFNGVFADGIWDIKWYSMVKHLENGWSVELSIPLKYLRFKENTATWNINFLRNDVVNNERSSWVPTPRYFNLGNLAYSGKLAWPSKIKSSSRNVSIVPGLTVGGNQLQQNEVQTILRPSVDAKISITPSLNLDVAINPDFSQAEVDQAQVNLTRFELVFPEKRFFFIENSDLFSEFGVDQWGTAPVRPFYSRRIGLRFNPSTGFFEQAAVLGGLRLSGKLNKNLRVGAMSMQTASIELENEKNEEQKKYYPSQNYSVLAFQQKVFSRSNIGMFMVNRQSVGSENSGGYRINPNDYNRSAGIDYNLASRDGTWTGKFFSHWLLSPDIHTPAGANGAMLQYRTLRTLSWIGASKVDNSYTPDAGFVPRKGYTSIYAELSYFLYPKKGNINFFQPVFHSSVFLDSLQRIKTDHRIITGGQIAMKNTGQWYLLWFNEYTRLTDEFNPAQNEGISLPTGSSYTYNFLKIFYISDLRKNFSYSFDIDLGQFFNGNIYKFEGFINRKIEPWGFIGVNYSMNFVRLPKPYSSNDLFLIGPRADISLSRSLFLNAIVQYNNNNQNLNFYSRLQWRFRPLSDLFVVYTNNQNTSFWQRQDRGLIVKCVLWL